ncbi:AAA family ATPase [Fictibacillus fluitans]|uniref:AAA family ATPase n=1 Tax=Fictibacillus fluitans TaxID=3058422 RepID=A0ABT8HT26_9BACL|nr:AAA family ATPase [Fictibacillus sp. NE201]MDN4523913.1 AAA family ATPase [Fictibacillus sp. NE201]
MNRIYIFSGPCGVGKSTISKMLAESMENVVLVHGDDIHSMFTGKNQPPWDEQLSIVWQNTLSITKNFLEHRLDIVLDYVVEDELEWFCRGLSGYDVEIYYVVLRADEDVLVQRLQERGNADLIDRSLFLLNQLENDPANRRYLYNTTNQSPKEILEDLRNRFHEFRL